MTMTGNGDQAAHHPIGPAPPLLPPFASQAAAERAAASLGHVTAAIVASAEPSTVTRRLLDAIRAATGVDRVLLVDPSAQHASPSHPFGAVDGALLLAELRDVPAASIEQAAETRQAVFCKPAASGREALCVPAIAFGTVQAVLYLEGPVGDGSILAGAADAVQGAASNLALCLLHRRSASGTEVDHRRDSHDEALRRTDAVATLAGGIAHDFNNHLTVINGLCDLLLDDARLTPVVRTDLNEIRTAGESAAVLTNQLLSYSGRQIIQPGPADLNRLLRYTEGKLRRALGEHIDLTFDLALDLGWAYLDEPQIEQVLLNLAANAREAIRGAGTVRIRTGNADLEAARPDAHPALGPGAYVCASVSDTGPGIPAHVRPRIFEPFFTTAPPGQRMGLGLPTAYGILGQLGGGIVVERAEGRGATFTLYFRRSAAPAHGDDEAAESTASRGERILIVEDRDDVRRLAIQVLSHQGYEILAASDGPAAIRMAAETRDPIDLLVTDVVMPGMNGRELATALTAARPGLKVLYTSGYTADQIGECGVLAEGTAYLRKPFSPRQLRTRVRKVLDQPAGGGPHPPDGH